MANDLKYIDQLIAIGYNRKKIADHFNLTDSAFGSRFRRSLGISFTKYKKFIKNCLNTGIHGKHEELLAKLCLNQGKFR